MDDVKVGDRLYHWRYGSVRVVGLDGPYMYISIDDPDRVIRIDGLEPGIKTFWRSCLHHWVHTNAIDAIVSNNYEFHFAAGSSPLAVFPPDPNVFHKGLQDAVFTEVGGLIGDMQTCRKYAEIQTALSGAQDRLRRDEEQLKAIKKNEARYPDHDEYDRAIRESRDSCDRARADAKQYEDELALIEKEIADKYGVGDPKAWSSDLQKRLTDYVRKAWPVLSVELDSLAEHMKDYTAKQDDQEPPDPEARDAKLARIKDRVGEVMIKFGFHERDSWLDRATDLLDLFDSMKAEGV